MVFSFKTIYQALRRKNKATTKRTFFGGTTKQAVITPFPDASRTKESWDYEYKKDKNLELPQLHADLKEDNDATVPLDINDGEDDCSYQGIDLRLPETLYPLKLEEFYRQWQPLPSKRLIADYAQQQLSDEGLTTYGIGSCCQLENENDNDNDDKIYYQNDTGIFQCVLEAWMNHWNLRTCPEDWWFPVACQIAKDLADATKGWERDRDDYYDSDYYDTDDNDNGRVPEPQEGSWAERAQKFFVATTTTSESNAKQRIAIDMPCNTIDEVDAEVLFQIISDQLHNRINVPEFVSAMQSDFMTSKLTHRIESQINLMSSLQQFFDYHLTLSGCGLRGIEMNGTQADWDGLVEKLDTVRKILKPLCEDDEESPLRNYWRKSNNNNNNNNNNNKGEGGSDICWLDHVRMVFENLALTKREPNNPEVADFWSGILLKQEDWKRKVEFYEETGPRTHQVPAYNGWLIPFLMGGRELLRVEDLRSGLAREQLSGLNQVSLHVSTTASPSEETRLVAGVMGFLLLNGEATFNGVPSLRPYHMWSMMLAPDSKLLR